MCSLTNFQSLIKCVVNFLERQVVPLLVGFAVFLFLWGVFRFVRNGGDETAREEGKKLILWGVVGLFVMLCVWGIVAVLANTLLGGQVVIPQVRI